MIISSLITLGVLIAVLLWVVLYDSRKRWPHLNAWQRYVATITFDAKRQDRIASRD